MLVISDNELVRLFNLRDHILGYRDGEGRPLWGVAKRLTRDAELETSILLAQLTGRLLVVSIANHRRFGRNTQIEDPNR